MSTYTKWERFYQKLNMIFHGIVSSTMIPFAWVFLETQKEFSEAPFIYGSTAVVVNTILLVMCGALIYLSQTWSKRTLQSIQDKSTIHEKLTDYLSQKVKVFAILEGAAFFSLIGLYLSKFQPFTVVYLIVLFVFSLQRPTFDRVSRETKITVKDLKEWGSEPDEK